MTRRLLRRPVTWVAIGVLTMGVILGLYWFQPWKLITDREVNEAVPSVVPGSAQPSGASPAAPANQLLAQGTLVTHEHETSGTVQLVRLADGRRQLVLRDLSTSDGPDLRVWLTDRPVIEGVAGWRVFDDGRYTELGPLKGNRGSQVYDIPADLDLSQYRSVSIWCKRFAVSFGAATLDPA